MKLRYLFFFLLIFTGISHAQRYKVRDDFSGTGSIIGTNRWGLQAGAAGRSFIRTGLGTIIPDTTGSNNPNDEAGAAWTDSCLDLRDHGWALGFVIKVADTCKGYQHYFSLHFRERSNASLFQGSYSYALVFTRINSQDGNVSMGFGRFTGGTGGIELANAEVAWQDGDSVYLVADTINQRKSVYAPRKYTATYVHPGSPDVVLTLSDIKMDTIGVPGTTAVLTPNIVGDQVVSHTIVDPGAGYSYPPNLIVQSSSGSGASGAPVITSGSVTGVDSIVGGSGYLTATDSIFGGWGTTHPDSAFMWIVSHPFNNNTGEPRELPTQIGTFQMDVLYPDGIQQLDIDASAGAHGSVSPSGTVVVNYGSSPSFTATPATGYHVDSLIVDNVAVTPAASYTFTNVSTNHTIRVTFAQNPIAISVGTSIPGLAFTVDDTVYTATHLFHWQAGSGHSIATDSLQLATADSQYVWRHWTDGGSLSHSIVATVDTTVTAVFVEQYQLNLQAQTYGIACSLSPASGWYPKDTCVVITAGSCTLGGGHEVYFSNWTGTGNGSYTGPLASTAVCIHGPITETAHYPDCLFSVTSPDTAMTCVGGAGVINVASEGGCAWRVARQIAPAWFHFDSDTTGAGNGSVSFHVDANPDTTDRCLELTYPGPGNDSIRTITICQKRCPPELSLSKSHIVIDEAPLGGSKGDSLIVSSTGGRPLVIDSIRSTNPVFSVTPGSLAMAVGESATVRIDYTPVTEKNDSGLVIFYHNGTTTRDTVSVSGIVYKTVTMTIRSGWNLISLAVDPKNRSKTALFPGAQSPAYGYDNGYHQRDTLEFGRGYWLRFGAGGPVSYFGRCVLEESLDLAAGWNLIGGITDKVPTSTVMSDPSGISAGRFFEYSGAYVATDTIDPGQGSWVKLGEAGQLTIESGISGTMAGRNAVRIVSSEEVPPPPPGEQSSVVLDVPKEFALDQNFPNPFNPTTSVRYALPVDSRVKLIVLNILGQTVATLTDGVQQAGHRTIEWDASGVPSGLYFYRLDAASTADPGRSFRQVRKMLLVK